MRTLSGRVLLSGLLAALALAAPPAVAQADTLDQQQTAHEFRGYVTGPVSGETTSHHTEWRQTLEAQTFTAGLSGPLDRIQLYLSKSIYAASGPLCVKITSVSSGAPGATVLAAVCVDASQIPSAPGGWVEFDFSPAPNVTAGSQYAIVASAGGADVYFWKGSEIPDTYSGGRAFINCSSTVLPDCRGLRPATWNPTFFPLLQFAFKTYVGPRTVNGCEIRADTVCPHADLSRTDLSYADLDGADLFHVNLSHAVLAYALLSHANLSHAIVANAILSRALLRDADLRSATLNGADLFRADLRAASLHGAVLHGADIRDADLRGANLTGAILYGADLSDANLTDAKLCHTVMPGGHEDNSGCH